jgi:hypothetical protein
MAFNKVQFPSWDFKTTGNSMKAVHWIKNRRLLFDTLHGRDDQWTLTMASTSYTDTIPLFKEVQQLVQSLMTEPIEFAEPKGKSHHERWEERRRVDAVNNCPPGQSQCPDLITCVDIGQDYTCPTECATDMLGQIACGLATANNATRNFDVANYLNQAVECWNNYKTQPNTDPTNPSSTPETAIYCFPLTPPITYRFPAVEYNLKSSLQTCDGGSCACPRYYPGTFDYNGRWFDFVSVSEEVRIINALIALQWIFSRVTVWLFYPDLIWYSFWSVFPLPQWWLRLLGDPVALPNHVQEWFCVVLHLGSLTYFLLLLTITLVMVEALLPLAYMLISLLQWPIVMCQGPKALSRFKLQLQDKTDVLEGTYWEQRIQSIEDSIEELDKKR